MRTTNSTSEKKKTRDMSELQPCQLICIRLIVCCSNHDFHLMSKFLIVIIQLFFQRAYNISSLSLSRIFSSVSVNIRFFFFFLFSSTQNNALSTQINPWHIIVICVYFFLFRSFLRSIDFFSRSILSFLTTCRKNRRKKKHF